MIIFRMELELKKIHRDTPNSHQPLYVNLHPSDPSRDLLVMECRFCEVTYACPECYVTCIYLGKQLNSKTEMGCTQNDNICISKWFYKMSTFSETHITQKYKDYVPPS